MGSVHAISTACASVSLNGCCSHTATACLCAPQVSGLDFVGVDCYFQLNVTHGALPYQNSALADIQVAWGPAVKQLASIAAGTGKQVVCTEVGWQSRPWAYAHQASTPQLDGPDCSVYDQCIDLEAQALAYTAFLSSVAPFPWYGGAYVWMWRADPTAGGTADDSFTPHGKPGAAVLSAFWKEDQGGGDSP